MLKEVRWDGAPDIRHRPSHRLEGGHWIGRGDFAELGCLGHCYSILPCKMCAREKSSTVNPIGSLLEVCAIH